MASVPITMTLGGIAKVPCGSRYHMTSNFSPSSNPGYMEQIVVAPEWPLSGPRVTSSLKAPARFRRLRSPRKSKAQHLFSHLYQNGRLAHRGRVKGVQKL
jgi:hypothetical protein